MVAKKILENERFFLRELTIEDVTELGAILQDEETMYAYEAPFTKEKVQEWLHWNLTSYEENGFGLWAIIDKPTQHFIGQCGIVYSEVEGEKLLEIGYLVNKRYWNQGYASAASWLCLNYAANYLKAERICSIIRDTNMASQKVASKNGLQVIQTFYKDYSGQPVKHLVYSIDLTTYKKRKW
jgi:ribosomal-protein-alanine N-acetyltransferase